MQTPDAGTALFAVMGNPVSHSLSPLMHNAAFRHASINGVYVAFEVRDIQAATRAMRALGIKGASITIPHKVAIVEHLDAIDPAAQKIGAVNTVVNENGRLTGLNTDGPGAIRALLETAPVRGKKVAVLGAGGAARAIAFAAAAMGGCIFILNRTPERGKALASDVGGGFLPLAGYKEVAFDILINATSVGMSPDRDAIPVPPDMLHPDMTVMDIVYNPLETRLLAEARRKGCATVDGVSMFVYQGALQFETWTGCTAPIQMMRKAVLSALWPQIPRNPKGST